MSNDFADALTKAATGAVAAPLPQEEPYRLIEAIGRIFDIAPERIAQEVSCNTALGKIARDFLGIETSKAKRGRKPIDGDTWELVAFVTRERIKQLERGEKENRRAAFWLYAEQKLPRPSLSDIGRFEKRYERAMKREFSPLASLFVSDVPDTDKIPS